MSLEDTIEFELEHWKCGKGTSCGARYILDTVLYHERGTNALFKAIRGYNLVNGKVIGIGCNAGGFLFFWSKKPEVTEVIGLDIVQKTCDEGEREKQLLIKQDFTAESWGETWCHPPNWDFSKVRFVCGSAHKIPFEDNYFDTVEMMDCIEHFPQDLRPVAVKQALRVLKPKGIYILSTLLDVKSSRRPDWKQQMLHEVHPFGVATEREMVDWVQNAGGIIIYKYIDWFGEEDKIQQIWLEITK